MFPRGYLKRIPAGRFPPQPREPTPGRRRQLPPRRASGLCRPGNSSGPYSIASEVRASAARSTLTKPAASAAQCAASEEENAKLAKKRCRDHAFVTNMESCQCIKTAHAVQSCAPWPRDPPAADPATRSRSRRHTVALANFLLQRDRAPSHSRPPRSQRTRALPPGRGAGRLEPRLVEGHCGRAPAALHTTPGAPEDPAGPATLARGPHR